MGDNELEWMCKEAIIANLEVLLIHLPWQTEQNNLKGQSSWPKFELGTCWIQVRILTAWMNFTANFSSQSHKLRVPRKAKELLKGDIWTIRMITRPCKFTKKKKHQNGQSEYLTEAHTDRPLFLPKPSAELTNSSATMRHEEHGPAIRSQSKVHIVDHSLEELKMFWIIQGQKLGLWGDCNPWQVLVGVILALQQNKLHTKLPAEVCTEDRGWAPQYVTTLTHLLSFKFSKYFLNSYFVSIL